MRQIRSADPWSTFLEPGERVVGSGPLHLAEGFMADQRPGHAGGGGGLTGDSRHVLSALTEADGPLTVEELHDRTGMTLLEVADAVRTLSDRGLVGLYRHGDDDVVRLATPELGGSEHPE